MHAGTATPAPQMRQRPSPGRSTTCTDLHRVSPPSTSLSPPSTPDASAPGHVCVQLWRALARAARACLEELGLVDGVGARGDVARGGLFVETTATVRARHQARVRRAWHVWHVLQTLTRSHPAQNLIERDTRLRQVNEASSTATQGAHLRDISRDVCIAARRSADCDFHFCALSSAAEAATATAAFLVGAAAFFDGLGASLCTSAHSRIVGACCVRCAVAAYGAELR